MAISIVVCLVLTCLLEMQCTLYNEYIMIYFLAIQKLFENLTQLWEEVQKKLWKFFMTFAIRPRGERIVFWWLNMNTNIILFFLKNERIWILILFGLPKMTKYKYKYYSVSQKWPNTNKNIIWLPKNEQIRIQVSFSFSEMTKYEYYLSCPKEPREKKKREETSQYQFYILFVAYDM